MAARQVESYLAAQKAAAAADASEQWNNLENLYRKKLWHQLTQYVLDLIYRENWLAQVKPVEFYENFVSEFEHRINPVSLLQIAQPILAQVSDPEDAVKLIEKIRPVVKNSEEALILCLVAEAEARLRKRSDPDANGQTPVTDLPKVRELVEQAQAKIDALPGVTTVHGVFYKTSANYLKEIANYTGYYKEALRYLGCIDVDTALTPAEQHSQALCLALAALLGEEVYNFGELLAHPVLNSLKGTPEAWLVELLTAFNAGDLDGFERLRPRWQSQPDLKKNEVLLRKKICLLCLMEMAYIRPATQRQISFEEIASAAKVSADEVEYLVMRALSLGLVRGHIDQVDQVVYFTWVQPRVLDRKQIGAMGQRMSQWLKDVQSMHNVVDVAADDIIAR